MGIEEKLSDEEKADILIEVERERRRILVCELYEKDLESDNRMLREGTARVLGSLVKVDDKKFIQLYKKIIREEPISFFWDHCVGKHEPSTIDPLSEQPLSHLATVNLSGFLTLFKKSINSQQTSLIESALLSLHPLAKQDPIVYAKLCEDGLQKLSQQHRSKIEHRELKYKLLSPLFQVAPEDFSRLWEEWIGPEHEHVKCIFSGNLRKLFDSDKEKFIGYLESGARFTDSEVRHRVGKDFGLMARLDLDKFLRLYDELVHNPLNDINDYHPDFTRARNAYHFGGSITELAKINPEKFIELYEKGISIPVSAEGSSIKDGNLLEVRYQIARTLWALADTDADLFVKYYQRGINSDDIYIKRGTAESLWVLASIDQHKFVEFYRQGINFEESEEERQARAYWNEDCEEVEIVGKIAESLLHLATVNPQLYTQLCEEGVEHPCEYVVIGTAKSLAPLARIDINKFLELNGKIMWKEINGLEKEIETAKLLPVLASTLEDSKLEPILDEEYEFLSRVLDSNLDLKGDAITELTKFLHKPGSKDYQKLTEILEAGEAKDLSEIVECASVKSFFKVVCKLGQGADGRTYKVRSKILEGHKALKVVDEWMNPQEARLMQKAKHPNITEILEADDGFVQVDGQEKWAILMEYVDGQTLRGLIDESPEGVEVQKALNYSNQLLNAISYLQQKKIVHHDLHPSNIKVNSSGVLKVLDFGIATRGMMISSEHDDKNRRYGGDSDLFSWGLMTYEMLTGEHFVYPRREGIGSSTYANEVNELKWQMREEDGSLKLEYQAKIRENAPEYLYQSISRALENTGGNLELRDFQKEMALASVRAYKHQVDKKADIDLREACPLVFEENGKFFMRALLLSGYWEKHVEENKQDMDVLLGRCKQFLSDKEYESLEFELKLKNPADKILGKLREEGDV